MSSSLLGPTFLLISLIFLCVSSQHNDLSLYPLQRKIRSFPYSVSFYKMLGYDRHLRPYYGLNDEVAALIDSMNREDETAKRNRRSPQNEEDEVIRNGPKWKRFACRLKFCRIY